VGHADARGVSVYNYIKILKGRGYLEDLGIERSIIISK
jgi:hypothetical protein